jgi:hypothetical protein
VVVGHHLGVVLDPPAGPGQVERQQLLLAAHAVAGLEAAGLEEGPPAYDRPAGEEPEHGDA